MTFIPSIPFLSLYCVLLLVISLLCPPTSGFMFLLPLLNIRTVVLLYNKPANVVTTHDTNDSKGRINVYQDILSMRGFVPSCPSSQYGQSLQQLTGVHPYEWNAIGRLDAETTGLLLITNDGGLVHHVTNKNSKTSLELGPLGKTYEAIIMGYHDEHTSTILQTIRHVGVNIGEKYGGQTDPARDITVLDHPSSKTTKVSLTIYEGKNRQVRRMFHALGSGVIHLRRVSIGKHLTLENLNDGQWRIMSDEEVSNSLNWTPRIIENSKHIQQKHISSPNTRSSRRKKKFN